MTPTNSHRPSTPDKTKPTTEITLMPNRGNGITLLQNSHGDIGNNILNTAVVNVPLTDNSPPCGRRKPHKDGARGVRALNFPDVTQKHQKRRSN